MTGSYDPHLDGYLSWQLAIFWLAVMRGSRSPRTCAELYWVEAWGCIP